MRRYEKRISSPVYTKREKIRMVLMAALASAIVLLYFYMGAHVVNELLYETLPPRQPIPNAKVIILPTEKPEWEDMVDINKFISEVRRKFGGRIKLAASKHGIDPDIITAIVVVESLGDPNVVSRAKAYGLMQLKKHTALEMGILDPLHPYDNLWAGARYLRKLLNRFGSLEAALAAYNMGPSRLERLMKRGYTPDLRNPYIRRVVTVKLYM
jgi:soluble lytic murein transglycosylase-like protein